MSLINRLAIFLLYLFSTCPILQAESLHLVAGNTAGKEIVIPVNSELSGKTVGIYAIGKTANDQTLEFTVSAPTGSVISVDIISAAKKETALQAASGARINATIYANGLAKSSFKLSQASTYSSSALSPVTAAAVGGDPKCGCLTETEIKSYLELLRTYQPGYTRETFCSMIPEQNTCETSGPTPTGTTTNPAPTSIPNGTQVQNNNYGNLQLSAGAFLSYNKCISGTRPGYLIKVSLAGVSAADLQNNEIRISAVQRRYSGEDRASIKEMGDGKYKSPLFLASPVGGYYLSSNKIQMVSWTGKKKKKVKNVKIADYVYYGGALLRAPLSGLSGGKGTFEVTGGYDGYAVCAAFAARRQNFNGYRTY